MYKKALLIAIMASSLFAGQYATLKDGKTIILHDNGTWEEIQLVKSADAQVAVMASKDLAQSPKAVSVSEPLARMLVGTWKSVDGSVAYEFRNSGSVKYAIDGNSKTDSYTIQFIDAKDNTLGVSIGDASRYGKVIFGGNFRKLRISKDGKSMTDYTDETTSLKTVELKKVGEATEPVSSVSAPPKKVGEPSLKNGFVK